MLQNNLDQELKSLNPQLFPELVKRWQANPEWLKQQVAGMLEKQPNVPVGSLLANLESDLQSDQSLGGE